MARKTTPPIIGHIPAEIHLEAQALGLIAETYTEVVAGHGVTGRVAWAVTLVRDGSFGFSDRVRLRYGTSSTHEHARADLRHALEGIRAAREQTGVVSE